MNTGRLRILTSAVAVAVSMSLLGVAPTTAYAGDSAVETAPATSWLAEYEARVAAGTYPTFAAAQTNAALGTRTPDEFAARVQADADAVDAAKVLAAWEKLYSSLKKNGIAPEAAAASAQKSYKLGTLPADVLARVAADQSAFEKAAAQLKATSSSSSSSSASERAAAYKKVPRYVITGGSTKDRARVKAVIKKYKVNVPRGTRIAIVSGFAHYGTTYPGAGANFTVTHNGKQHSFAPAGTIKLRRSILSGTTLRRYVVLHELFHLIQWEAAGHSTHEMKVNAKGFGKVAGNWRTVDYQADCYVWAKAGRGTALVRGSYLSRFRSAGKCTATQRTITRQLAKRVK